MTTSSPKTAHVVVLRYHDNSGNIAAFGPYQTEQAAKDAIPHLMEMPLRDGTFEVLACFGAPGAPTPKLVMR